MEILSSAILRGHTGGGNRAGDSHALSTGELMGLTVMEEKIVSESFSSGPLKEITDRLVI